MNTSQQCIDKELGKERNLWQTAPTSESGFKRTSKQDQKWALEEALF